MNQELDHPQQSAWRKPKVEAEIPKYPVACCRDRNFSALLLLLIIRSIKCSKSQPVLTADGTGNWGIEWKRLFPFSLEHFKKSQIV